MSVTSGAPSSRDTHVTKRRPVPQRVGEVGAAGGGGQDRRDRVRLGTGSAVRRGVLRLGDRVPVSGGTAVAGLLGVGPARLTKFLRRYPPPPPPPPAAAAGVWLLRQQPLH